MPGRCATASPSRIRRRGRRRGRGNTPGRKRRICCLNTRATRGITRSGTSCAALGSAIARPRHGTANPLQLSRVVQEVDMRRNLLLGVVAAAVMAAGVPLVAHHAFGGEFDANRPVLLKGKVSKVEWVNP